MHRLGTYVAAMALASCGGNGGARPSPPAPTLMTQTETPETTPRPRTPPDPQFPTCAEREISELPSEPTIASDATVTVRAASLIVREPYDVATHVMYCTLPGPLPEGARLVAYVFPEGTVAGVLGADGQMVADGHSGRGDLEVVALERPITTIRRMNYCPTDRARPCIAAGSYERIRALSPLDPAGPRSGWDFAEGTDELSRSQVAPVSTPFCGLTMSWRGLRTQCATGELTERLACLRAKAIEVEDLRTGPEPMAGAAADLARELEEARLALSDGAREVALPVLTVDSLACVGGHPVIRLAPPMYTSLRGFVALDVADGRIARARRMTVRDHEEQSSDCGNAWDGVALVPVLRGAEITGGVVAGAMQAVQFGFGRGDMGDVSLPEGGGPGASVDTYPPPIPVAFRSRGRGWQALWDETGTVAPCPLRVQDDDGHTNVRPDPSTRRPPVGTLPSGTTITPTEQRGRWYRIAAPLAGWVFARSLRRSCD